MPSCRVHILSSSADKSYSSTTFTIGEQVQQEDYDRFKDDKGDLHLLVYLDEGKVQSRIVARDAWDEAKTAIDRHRAAIAGQQEIKPPLDSSSSAT
jgi:hypothetical protein